MGKNEQPITVNFSESQEKMIMSMIKGNFYGIDILKNEINPSLIDIFIANNVLVDRKIDTSSIFSRTNAFFMNYNMNNARDILSKKTVIILGCGGIGTHIAWHMTVLGVKKIILLDYDLVEESNLNRQFLFDREDIGKIKVDVLKNKLQKINDQIKIDCINTKINSKDELNKILKSNKIDLIIKSLDSPNSFPVWLDSVCKSNNLSYISGITLRNEVLIGPTFIPGKSKLGMSDLLPIEQNYNVNVVKVSGVSPSLGIMLYHIADEIAIEAFKVLTNIGNLKYENKIIFENIFNNTQRKVSQEIVKENENLTNDKFNSKALILNFIQIGLLSALAVFIPIFTIVSMIIAEINSFVLYDKKNSIIKCTIANFIVVMLASIFPFIYNNFSILFLTSVITGFLIIIGLFCIFSMGIIALCLLNTILCNLFKIK